MEKPMTHPKGTARRSYTRRSASAVEALEPRQLLTIAFPTYVLGSLDGITPVASAADRDGNVTLLGDLTGVADFNPSSRKTHLIDGGEGSYFLAQYAPSGALRWAQSLGEDNTANCDLLAMATDRAGNLYVAGSLFGEIDADPGRKVRTRTATAEGDVMVIRFNADGAFLAAGVQNLPGGDVLTADQLKVDSLGNAYVAGTYGDEVAPSGFLSKFGKSGAPAWANDLDDSAHLTLALDRNQAPAIVAQTATVTSMAVTRFTNSGRYVSRQVLSESASKPRSTLEPVSLDFDLSNYPIIAGDLTGYADFDPTPAAVVRGPVLANEDFSNVFLARYTPKGALSFAQVIGGHAVDKTAGAVVDPNSGNIYLTGSFNGDTDFDPGTGAFMMTTLNNVIAEDSPSDLFVAKYTAAGKFLTAAQLESHKLRDDAVTMAFSPLTATSARVYVFGHSTGFRAGKEAISIFETVR